jgi:hypothetical protein
VTYDRGARVVIQRMDGALADDLTTRPPTASAPPTVESS